MAANQTRLPSVMLGWYANVQSNTSSLSLNAAATWLALQFYSEQAKTLNTVRLNLQSKTGTPTAAGCTCDLYSDNGSGNPSGTSLESRPADSVPANGLWMQWSGFTTALTAHTSYWLVFKNNTATPASNFPTYQWGGTGVGNTNLMGNWSSTVNFWGWNKVQTGNSGGTWTTGQNAVMGPRLGYSDGTYDGMPVSGLTRPTNALTTDSSFGKQEAGVKFNVPANMKFNCKAVWFNMCKVGSPGNLTFKIYQGTTLLATSLAIPAGIIGGSTNDTWTAYFASPVQLTSANNPYRLTMVDATSADTSTNRYCLNIANWDTDSNSLPLKPMDGSLTETMTTDNTAGPPVFTDTAGNVAPFLLFGDTSGEFTSTGGGGGATSNAYW